MGDSMRYEIFYDGKEKYPLCSCDTKEMAEAWIKEEANGKKCALFPSLSADIGLMADSPLWGGEITPEALRAVSYYLGILAGWPMDAVSVDCGEKKPRLLPLASKSEEKISCILRFCKQMFENTTVFCSSVSHAAVRFHAPFPFVMIDSACPRAVDLYVAKAMREEDEAHISLPLCFAALEGESLFLRACMRGRAEVQADDSMYMRALAYFYLSGRASIGAVYEGNGGFYRVRENQTVEALRILSPAPL